MSIAKQKIREFIREMNKRGTTFILTTHDLEDVEQLAKNIVIINHGESCVLLFMTVSISLLFNNNFN